VVQAPAAAAPLVEEVCRFVLRAGGHVEPQLALEEARHALLGTGSDSQLDWVDPRFAHDVESADVRVAILGTSNTRALSSVDPTREARLTASRGPYLKRLMERSATGEHRWVVTTYPTQAAAQEAGMSLAAYERHVFRASLLDDADPVARWRELGARIRAVAERLSAVEELRVVAPGTDLRLGVAGRTWIPCHGDRNLPDGECFTAPIETSAEGHVAFTYPAVWRSRSVAGVRLGFREGEVVDATASRGLELLEQMLAMDEGARRIGELAFGLNDAVTMFTGETLLDEKIGGTIHLALGEAYPESGGTNSSALHWDMVCDLRGGGEVYADGELVYRDGRFLWDAA
jgi:aminopeptidase